MLFPFGVTFYTGTTSIILFRVLGQVLVQNGKVNFTLPYADFLYCTNVQYPQAFSSSGNIRVLASIGHGKESASVHDSAVVWTSNVTQSSFRVCVLESGLGTNGSFIANWISFRGTPSGMLDGTASFSLFTSGTKCETVNFAKVWLIVRFAEFSQRCVRSKNS